MAQNSEVYEEDLIEIGEKIVEMAERTRIMHMALPGAVARWCFEMDDTRHQVTLSVAVASSSAASESEGM